MAVEADEAQDFAAVVGRLDEIVEAVRKKDVSLERSLDLLDEAIKLGGRAVALVDSAEFSPEEQASMGAQAPADEAPQADGAAADETR